MIKEVFVLGGRAVKLHSLTEKAKLATGVRSRDFAAPVLVGVVGLPGSGKRTFCGMLSAILGSDGVLLLSEDIYLTEPVVEDLPAFNESWRMLTEPKAIEQGHMGSHLDDLDSGCSIFVPEYDWDVREKLASWQLMLPRPVVVVEGMFLFSDKSLADRFDHRIFLDAKPDVCFDRVVSRAKGASALGEEKREAWSARFREFSEKYLEPQRGGADIVISGDAPFESPLLDLCAHVLDEVFARRRK